MCYIFFLNLQDLLTGKYHEQKNLDEEKRLKKKTKSAQKRELKKKHIYEVEAQYVTLSCLLLSKVPILILINLADLFMVLLRG
jgi:cytoskeletal protein RodZ